MLYGIIHISHVFTQVIMSSKKTNLQYKHANMSTTSIFIFFKSMIATKMFSRKTYPFYKSFLIENILFMCSYLLEV
jgi:hypothetical protein